MSSIMRFFIVFCPPRCFSKLKKIAGITDSRDNTKEQCSCISIVMIPFKQNSCVKSSKNNMKDIMGISMDRGKDALLLLPYNYAPSSSTVRLLLRVQCYQKCEPITLKLWVKSKFVLWQPRYYNLLTEEKNKRINVLEVLIFSKKPSLDDTLLGNFTFSISIILVEDLIRWKKTFEIFLIDHYASDIENKNIVSKY